MKKIVYLLSILILMQVIPANGVYAEENVVEIHVSVDGNDSGDGSLQHPLKTIEAAKKEVKKRKKIDTEVRVIVHEGEYRVTKQLVFNNEDSGSKNSPITYMAANGENVVFKGSVILDSSKFEPVSDMNIYKRLPQESADHIGQLDLKAQGIKNIAEVRHGNYTTDPINSNQLYLNETEQTLARWPNAGYSIDFTTLSSTDAIFVGPSRVTQWQYAKDLRIGGFPCIDYAYDKARVTNLDVNERTITLNKSDLFGNIGVSGRRWFAYNLLEEIDMPGEWYIDKDTSMLYYYPMYPLTGVPLEMSVLTDAMLYFKNCSYINFEGITIKQVCGDAIFLEGCSDMSFTGMSFSDIGRTAIGTDKYTQSYANANIIVDSSKFNNIGSTAVIAFGGNMETLEPGNYMVKNSYFNNLSKFRLAYAPAVDMIGVGNSVYNCTMSGSAAQMVVIKGSEHKVMYNEFYDSCRELNDTGVIYSFGNATYRGNEIAYNYIHDYMQPENTAGLLCGVYLDNGISGWSVHHNIIKNMPRGVFVNGGQDNNIYNNIVIDSPKGIQFGTCANNKTYDAAIYKKALEYAKRNLVYFEKYPDMKKIDLENTTLRNNKVTGNLLVNSGGNVFEENEGFIKWSEKGTDNKKHNNLIINEINDFKDTENYSLKEDSQILDVIPELKDIDINKVGIKGEKTNNVFFDYFTKVYPYNGQQNVNAKGLILRWTYPKYAERFHIKISTDSEMNDIVFEGDTINNYIKAENIETGRNKYYWQVEASNGSNLINVNCSNSELPYMFVTSLHDTLDQNVLKANIEKAEKILAGLTEGDKPGECEEGTREFLKNAIDNSEKMVQKKYGHQQIVDDENENLNMVIKSTATKIHKGYGGIDDLLSNIDKWEVTKSDSAYLQDGRLILKEGSHRVGTISNMRNYFIYKYRMKVGLNEKGGVGIALRQSSFADSWDQGILSYLVIIKKDVIELHVYNNQFRGIVRTVENKYIKADEWNDIETGAIDVDGGIQILVRINGMVVFNYLDETRSDTSEGIMQFSNLGCDYVEIEKSDYLPELDKNLIRGAGNIKTTPEEKYSKEIADLNLYHYVGGAASISNGILELKGTEVENYFVFEKKLEGNEVINAEILLNPGEKEQTVSLYANKDGTVDNNCYKFVITKDFIELRRYSILGNQILSRIPNNFFADGKWTSVTFGAYPNGNGTRIMLYADECRIVDYIDTHTFVNGGYLKLVDKSLLGIKLK